MMFLLVLAVMARELVLVGERYAPADLGGWPSELGNCLAIARPGAYTLVDGTAPGAAWRDVAELLGEAPKDALVIVSIAPPSSVLERWTMIDEGVVTVELRVVGCRERYGGCS